MSPIFLPFNSSSFSFVSPAAAASVTNRSSWLWIPFERLVVLDAAIDEILGRLQELGVHGLHAFPGQWAGVVTALLAHSAELGIVSRVVLVRRPAIQHTARTKLFIERRILDAGIVELFRLFFGI